MNDKNATEKFILNAKKSKYVAIAWIASIAFLITLRANDLIDPLSTIGQALLFSVFIGGMIVWAIARFIFLKCPKCNTSFVLQKRTPDKCPKCQLPLKNVKL
jgi:hypothetical protein